MFLLQESIQVEAPVERCFLLSTSIDLVAQTLKLRPVKGKTTGAIVDRDRVVWRGWKFGFPAFHETLITGYSLPSFFQDTMARGYFKHFQHDHHFDFIDGRTSMRDVVRCTFPLGSVGHRFGRMVVVPHIQQLLRSRHLLLKRLAEGDGWREYITEPADLAFAQRATEEASSGS